MVRVGLVMKKPGSGSTFNQSRGAASLAPFWSGKRINAAVTFMPVPEQRALRSVRLGGQEVCLRALEPFAVQVRDAPRARISHAFRGKGGPFLEAVWSRGCACHDSYIHTYQPGF